MRIGNPSLDLAGGERVFLWQYSNASRLNKILQAEIDFWGQEVSAFVKNWQRDVFNLKTANSFGLEVWGKILGTRRPVVSPQNYMIDTDGHLRFFNVNDETWHQIWLSGIPYPQFRVQANPDTPRFDGVLLNDEAYRRCLLARLFLLHSNVSVHDINNYLQYLFPQKPVYIQDNFDMTMSIVFGYIPSDVDLSIITFGDFAPRPAGVNLNYGVTALNRNIFSFEGMDLSTWGTNENTLDPEQVRQGLGTFYNL